jgi:hypothetical protein
MAHGGSLSLTVAALAVFASRRMNRSVGPAVADHWSLDQLEV